jgi:hypothetical protein
MPTTQQPAPPQSEAKDKPQPQTHTPPPHQTGVEPSGPRGDNPATAGPGQTSVRSATPENASGAINPSSPEDANVTPGSVPKK